MKADEDLFEYIKKRLDQTTRLKEKYELTDNFKHVWFDATSSVFKELYMVLNERYEE